MRIIGHIEHPHLKITIFKMDNRVSVKFESGLYEQTYKLGDDERFQTPESIQKLMDMAFVESVLTQMQQMHQNRLSALSRHFPAAENETFEEII